jgi:hypothetical protein
MRTIPLPRKQEGDEYIIYYKPRLTPGSWMTGTVQADGVPDILSRLDMALPEPFP